MDPILALDLPVAAPGSRAVLKTLHGALREAIVAGRLAAGYRLPSTRDLAQMLNVSRNTAVAAYELLASEGYVRAAGRAGTCVSGTPLRRARSQSGAVAPEAWPVRPASGPALPNPAPAGVSAPAFRFDTGIPAVDLFPFDVYRRLSARTLRMLVRQPADYGDIQGSARLREAIARHVAASRAVACTPDDVLVTAGAQQAFDLLARVLVQPGQTVVAVEDPGYPPLRAAMAAAGARLAAVPLDAEGLRVDKLPRACRVICVTPSHQFPLGMVMSAARRRALLAQARRREAVVIEDDYDAEFRFTGRPLDALKTLDEDGRVFYVGTFSKTMFPGLRLGFIVAPAWARAALLQAKQIADFGCNRPTQDTVAAFIDEGHLLRHLRRMTREYAHRRDTLIDAIGSTFGATAQIVPAAAGLHLALLLPHLRNVGPIVQRARAAGVAVESLRRYAIKEEGPAGLALGFGAIDARRIPEGIRRLAAAVRGP